MPSVVDELHACEARAAKIAIDREQKYRLCTILGKSRMQYVLDPLTSGELCVFAPTVDMLCEASQVCQGLRGILEPGDALDEVMEVQAIVDRVAMRLVETTVQT